MNVAVQAEKSRYPVLMKLLRNCISTAVSTLRAVRHRRHLAELSELSDHHLADMGLLRADLIRLERGRLTDDPTHGLTEVCRQRAAERWGRI